MTLTTLIITNAVLAALLLYGLVHLLTHGVLADRRHTEARVAEITALPVRDRGRIAA